MYEDYNPEKVKQYFDQKLRVLSYDTLRVRNFNIDYLSNKRDTYIEEYDYLRGVRNPYLALISRNGDNITSLSLKSLDEELTNNFHLIAIDCIGSGGSRVGKNSHGEPYEYYDSEEAFEAHAVYASIFMLE